MDSVVESAPAPPIAPPDSALAIAMIRASFPTCTGVTQTCSNVPLRKFVAAVFVLLPACGTFSGYLRATGSGVCVAQEPRGEPVPDAPRPTTGLTYRNPIIPHIGPADPAVIRFRGKYYLYPTWDGRGYDVFVSDDLVHWEQKPKCFVDDRGGAWAPDVFWNEKGDGKFYLYFTVDNPAGGKLMGVAQADGPLGPFTDPTHVGNGCHRCTSLS